MFSPAGVGFPPLPSPVGVVEVTGITNDAEGVVEVVVYDAPACSVRERALQLLRALAKARRGLPQIHTVSINFAAASQPKDAEAANPPSSVTLKVFPTRTEEGDGVELRYQWDKDGAAFPT